MVSDIIADSGNPESNSYIAIDEADTYFNNRVHSTSWTNSDGDSKAKALLTATKFIDNSHSWDGTKVSPEQVLEFPRNGLRIASFDSIYPIKLRDAVCEYAIYLLGIGSHVSYTAASIGSVTEAKIGDISYKEEMTDNNTTRDVISSITANIDMIINNLLKELFKQGEASAGSVGSFVVVRS